MQRTKIEYATHSWPIITGCSQPPSVCATRATCWARGLHKRFGKQWASLYNPDFSPKFNRQLLNAPLRLKKPARILVAFTGDMFGPGTDPAWISEVWDRVRICNGEDFALHTFVFLTKSPENLIQFNPWPANAWVGASATDEMEFGGAYFHLTKVQAQIKYISLEPLLSWAGRFTLDLLHQAKQAGISWLIIGAQSGPGAVKPKLDWVLDIIKAADKAGVKLWIKNNLLDIYPLPRRQELP